MIFAAIETVSPAFADHLRDNPDLIMKLKPRVEALLGKKLELGDLLTGKQVQEADFDVSLG